MQTYEFSSIVEKEGVIHIPQQFLKKISSPVKVILLADEKNLKGRNKRFSAMALKTGGFRFNREEANER
ncbi:MAG: hypothetical protein LBV38_02140 [Alistipes sp.]|nr:hypothetical protein [Alistipes sp.]